MPVLAMLTEPLEEALRAPAKVVSAQVLEFPPSSHRAWIAENHAREIAAIRKARFKLDSAVQNFLKSDHTHETLIEASEIFSNAIRTMDERIADDHREVAEQIAKESRVLPVGTIRAIGRASERVKGLLREVLVENYYLLLTASADVDPEAQASGPAITDAAGLDELFARARR